MALYATRPQRTVYHPQPTHQPLIAWNKVDGFCYQRRRECWVPISAPDAAGTMRPIDPAAFATIPVHCASDDFFVLLNNLDQHCLPSSNTDSATPSPDYSATFYRTATATPTAAPMYEQYPVPQALLPEYAYPHLGTQPLSRNCNPMSTPSTTFNELSMNWLSPTHTPASERQFPTMAPREVSHHSHQHPSSPPHCAASEHEYRDSIARLSNNFLSSSALQLHRLDGTTGLSTSQPTTMATNTPAHDYATQPLSYVHRPLLFSETHGGLLDERLHQHPYSIQHHLHMSSLPAPTTAIAPAPSEDAAPADDSDYWERVRGATGPPMLSSPLPQGVPASSPPSSPPLSSSSVSPTSPSVATQSTLKPAVAKKNAEKKQTLACLFCRERKIACGRPPFGSADQTCNQCARRRLDCRYPTESRRGQHKRLARHPNGHRVDNTR